MALRFADRTNQSLKQTKATLRRPERTEKAFLAIANVLGIITGTTHNIGKREREVKLAEGGPIAIQIGIVRKAVDFLQENLFLL